MKEIHKGNARNNITIRFFRSSWTQWWKRLFYKSEYDFDLRCVKGSHRCWCMDGFSFDGRIVIAGFGIVWFFSHWPGRFPCSCDYACCESGLHTWLDADGWLSDWDQYCIVCLKNREDILNAK